MTRPKRWPIWALGAVSLVTGCATSGADESGAITKTHYTLKLGEVIPSHPPLPSRTNIQVTWHLSNGGTEDVLGYRGWDFNGDQRFEMVEVLEVDGKVQARVFDFDGDGRIDRVQ